MLKRRSFCLTGISTLAIFLSICAVAQEGGPPNKAAAQVPQPDDKSQAQRESNRPQEAYHLQFTLSEIEDNRTINMRQYALDLSTNEANDIKIGTRVPFESKQGEFQYLDLGTHIHARLEDRHGQTTIVVLAEMSSFALDDQDKHDTHPLIRQIRIEASTLLQLDKPVVMGSADDPNSKRRFQLEMTATKLM
jgi:hypothetical protein